MFMTSSSKYDITSDFSDPPAHEVRVKNYFYRSRVFNLAKSAKSGKWLEILFRSEASFDHKINKTTLILGKVPISLKQLVGT